MRADSGRDEHEHEHDEDEDEEASVTQTTDDRASNGAVADRAFLEQPEIPAQRSAEPVTPQPGAPAAVRPPRVLALDALRLGAALMVVAYHLIGDKTGAWQQPAENIFGPVHTASTYGFLGVQLFFIISGFVICMSTWGRSVGDFFVSRVVRLYPAYWLAVVLAAGVLVVGPAAAPGGKEVLANLTMMQEFLSVRHLDLSYWTLAVEMIFYIFFAIVVARGLTYRRVVAFCAIWTVVALAAPKFGSPWLGTVVVANHFAYFVAGIAFYLIHRFGQNLLLWSIVGLSWLIALVKLPGLAMSRGVSFTVSAAIVTVFFMVMAAVALGLFSWVTARWVTTAGALTYPLYLIHQTTGLAVIERAHTYVSPWLLIAALVAGLLVLAWLIHRLVERPVSRWMKRRLGDSFRQLRAAG
ncbi:acyltransferase family protein [Catellatospora vulcania]|uniref:acyltransferase family protein n=1 Tax=Catellatospora vulcania TaxID=1460450 RepID=UPI0012D45DB5|nr:acyltransferase [Catellatospora vulcania]